MCNFLTDLQIHPDEVEDDGKVILIWDFNKINLSFFASQCSVKAKIPSSDNKIYSMPYLDLNRVNCNCAKSSKQGKVLLSCAATSATTAASRLQRLLLFDLSHINEEDGLEEEGEEAEELELQYVDEEFDLVSNRVNDSETAELLAPENTVCDCGETLFTETFTLKGSSFHEHFQNALKICKQKMINKEPVPVKLSFEPVNRREENAILVRASTEDS